MLDELHKPFAGKPIEKAFDVQIEHPGAITCREVGSRNFSDGVTERFDMRSLALQAGLTERYVGKVFGCALLAPDIIESILEGRQPHDLNFERLCQDVPLSWAEQRQHFAFPPVSS